jgi:hypothetical protein
MDGTNNSKSENRQLRSRVKYVKNGKLKTEPQRTQKRKQETSQQELISKKSPKADQISRRELSDTFNGVLSGPGIKPWDSYKQRAF